MFQDRLVKTCIKIKRAEQDRDRAQVNQQAAFRLFVRNWQGWVRQSVVRGVQEEQEAVRDEGDAEDKDHW